MGVGQLQFVLLTADRNMKDATVITAAWWITYF